jgi:hypothetical protein
MFLWFRKKEYFKSLRENNCTKYYWIDFSNFIRVGEHSMVKALTIPNVIIFIIIISSFIALVHRIIIENQEV